MSSRVYHMSKTDEWETPQDLFDKLNDEFNFTLDPCATKENAKCDKFYTKEEDGYKQSWANEVVFMNPPFGREIKKWIRKAYLEAVHNEALVVCLIPARTDTKYWHDYIQGKAEVRFIKGRLKYSNAKYNAPFPSAIIIFKRTK